MFRLLSKITLIAVALLLLSTQVQAQSTNGLPTLYRNGQPVSRGAPADPQAAEFAESEASAAMTEEELIEIPAAPAEAPAEEPVVVPAPEYEAATQPTATTEPAGMLAPPATGGGIFDMLKSLGLIVVPALAAGFGFVYFKKRRKPAVVEDAMPLPAASMADNPSKLREAIAEMKGPVDQSQSA